MSRKKPAVESTTEPINAITETVVMDVRDLVGADYNPRQISEKKQAGLEASLRKFGLVQQIVWNKRSRRVVGGHKRLEILARAGVARASVNVVDLDEIDEKALNVTLNNPHITGEFTDELEQILADLAQHDETMTAELMLDELRQPLDLGDGVELEPIEIEQPPSVTWVLIGIPTSRYGEVAGEVERIMELDGVTCEMMAKNTEPTDGGP